MRQHRNMIREILDIEKPSGFAYQVRLEELETMSTDELAEIWQQLACTFTEEEVAQ